MQTGVEEEASEVEKEASEVEVEVAFGVVVVEDVIGCLKFNLFCKLYKHKIRLGTREVNRVSENLNLHVLIQVKEVHCYTNTISLTIINFTMNEKIVYICMSHNILYTYPVKLLLCSHSC
jgi:dipeptide/tripeptide permease